MHSRTMQDVLANLKNLDAIGFYFAHGHPIPDCHNIIVEEALEDKPDYIWLVEDDQAIPPGTLDKLLGADAEVAVCDYPVNGLPCIKYKDGEFLYGGLGCTLIKTEVFDKLQRPYFRTDTEYQEETMDPRPSRNPNAHGLLDVDFWVRIAEANVKVTVVGNVGHYKLISPLLPKRGNQTGLLYKVEKQI